MKLLVAVLALFVVGAAAQMDDSVPAIGAELAARIYELQRKVQNLEKTAARFVTIGRANVRKLNDVMNRVDPERRKCLVLETLRPAPIPPQPLPDVPLKPLTGDPLSIEQISARVYTLERKVNKLAATAGRFVSIGKGNIGLMQRFAEASRSLVCGPEYHSKCPVGYVYNSVSDSCLREIVGRYRGFTEAQNMCHQRGGHLPRVRTLEKNNALPGLLQLGVVSPSPDDLVHALWVGLHKNADGQWQWVHPEQDPIDLTAEGAFINFNDAEEVEGHNCAYLCTMSNKWVKTSCETKTRILCERPAIPQPQV